MSVYGNEILAFGRQMQFLTVDGTSDTVELPAGLEAVDLTCDVAVYVNIGRPGETPVAAAPGAEKTEADGQYLLANQTYSYPLPMSTDAKKVKIAAIQVSSGGTLRINYRALS